MISLPESYHTKPDEYGICTHVSFLYNDTNQLVKITAPYRPIYMRTRIYEAATFRRTLPKFGIAVGPDNVHATAIGDNTIIEPVIRYNPEEAEAKAKAAAKAKDENDLPTLNELLGDAKLKDEGPKKYKPRGWSTPGNTPEETPVDGKRVFRPKQRMEGYVEVPVKLFVSNIASDLEESVLYDAFSWVGQLRNVFIPKHYDDPNRNKGFAFVSFYDHETAKLALEKMNHTPLCGMIIEAKFAEDKRM